MKTELVETPVVILSVNKIYWLINIVLAYIYRFIAGSKNGTTQC
jgi:hypothetical protein